MTANIRTVRRNHTEYHAVQVAASDRPAKTCTRQMMGHFRKARVPPKRIVREFPVTPDAHIPIGKSTPLCCKASSEARQVLRSLLSILSQGNSWMLLLIRSFFSYALMESLTHQCIRRIGKGFQGVMKRWGYHGLAASHGVSVSHRSAGSTGQHQVNHPYSRMIKCLIT